MTPPIAIMVRCRCLSPFLSSVGASVVAVIGVLASSGLVCSALLASGTPSEVLRNGPRQLLCQDERHVGAGPLVAPASRRWWATHRGDLAGRGRRPPLGGQAALRAHRAARALTDPTSAGYWRREAEVARAPAVVDGPGLVPPEFGTVEEDESGVTVWSLEHVGQPPPGLFVARALGRFAGAPYTTPSWASRRLLADRLDLAEERGGWPTLARTTVADVADSLWQRRHHWLGRSAEGPEGRRARRRGPGQLPDQPRR